MSSWYSSWLPGLPSINFALPSSIQRRFISFVLKKSLGHLLKPGQLDVHQIDSQIGSGYVQVSNLELDNEAINSLVSGFPVTLHDGFISSATAQIPWPNPLTSTLGFSLDTLHLTFHLIPASNHTQQPNTNIAESATSVAESFIHDELTAREEATLWESFHPELASSLCSKSDEHNVPGSLDPFITAPEDEQFHTDVDPAGVSIFASLIERLLARFEFDAVNTKITLVHPGHTSFTVSIPEIHYRTEAGISDEHKATDEEDELPHGETRTVSISGVTLTACNLRSSLLVVPSPSPLTPTTLSRTSPNLSSSSCLAPNSPHHSSPSVSPTSSSSSLDEDTQFMMSQSLAFLPPRLTSPTSSTASSMYQSAISTAPTFSDNRGPQSPSHSIRGSRTPSPGGCDHREILYLSPHTEPKASQIELVPGDELVLSFGVEPISIQLSTPPPGHFQQTKPQEISSPHSPSSRVSQEMDNASENLQFSVTAGVVACAVRAWHIRGMLDLLDTWESHRQRKTGTMLETASSSGHSSASILGLGFEVSVKVRGVVVLALPLSPMSRTETAQGSSGYVSKTSFFARPLVPPQLPHGCVRLHLESISAVFLSSIPSNHTSASTESRTRAGSSQDIDTTSVSLDFSLGELSLFAFHRSLSQASELDTNLLSSPLLITDHHLPTVYPSTHFHPDPTVKPGRCPELPAFDVMDWTQEKHQQSGTKLSLWRTKLRHRPAKHEHGWRDNQIKIAVMSSTSEEVKVGKGDDRHSKHTSLPPAIMVTGKRVFSSSSSNHEIGKTSATEEVEVKVVPLHLFVDLGQVLSEDGALAFLDEIFGSTVDTDVSDRQPKADEKSSGDDEDHSEDERNTPPTTPRVHDSREPQREREKERLRLEKLVLEDLNLDLDYPVKGVGVTQHGVLKRGSMRKRRMRRQETPSNVLIKLPMIRLQVRCPCPSGRSPRSGALVLDFHDVRLSTGLTPGKPPPRFTVFDYPLPSAASQAPEGSGGNVLLAVECRRIAVAESLVGESRATTILSLGSLNSVTDVSDELRSGTTLPSPLRPRIVLTKSIPPSKPSSSTPISTLALSVDIPSVHANISKYALDGLQYWADDAAQLVEQTFGGDIDDTDTEKADSRDTSLIGSRFFAKSRSGSGSGSGLSTSHGEAGSETVIKVAISEAFVRLILPREQEGSTTVRPFDIIASDTDILLELKPEGKDETVLTLGVMDLTVADTTSSGSPETFLSLTTPRSLSSVPKSLLKLRFTSLIVPETTAKETRIRLTLWGFTYNLYPDFSWASEMAQFLKAPPGAFESVIPSERTRISVKIMDSSLRAFAPRHPGAMVFHVGNLDFSTDIVGDAPDSSFHLSVPSLVLLVVDDVSDHTVGTEAQAISGGVSHWKETGYALLGEIIDLDMNAKNANTIKPPDSRVVIDRIGLRLHLCADSLSAVSALVGDLGSAFKPRVDEETPKPKRRPTMISEQPSKRGILSSVDDHAFKQVPEVGPAPDMIYDDLPTNLDYLDESFGTAAGLREFRDDDLDEFDTEEIDVGRAIPIPGAQQTGIISKIGGETIKILRPEGIHAIENYFDTLPPDAQETLELGTTTLRIRVHNADVALFLYDGYDWAKTRKTIEDQVKEMRRRLAKIRQLVASGQTQDPSIEGTSAVLFNSVYIGLEQDIDDLEPGALIAAIDEELKDDIETASQSSWQSLRPPATAKPQGPTRVHGKRLTRSRGPSIEFRMSGADVEVDKYRLEEPIVSRTFATIKDLEIFDHIKTSTWKKFLTELRSDSRGNVRETDSNMVRVELRSVRPVPGDPSEEARLRAKILPLRLYVDQDALDFLKQFFSFKDLNAPPASTVESDDGGIYFQLAEIFPVELKLDYKPRRVDYRALREGKTIELMNFFHFDGAEMTLRHITLNGITGWPRLFDMLNDLWTPDVKATQLVDVISGVAPIRSVVNVGSGVADLVLLPIAQYKKDGRIVRGMQKGTTAFVKSTAMEAIKLGARLATGTQVILEQAEGVLGGQFKHPITTETLQVPIHGDDRGLDAGDEEGEALDVISRYAQQPVDIKEGVQSAYKSLQRNFNSAAQTILAVPMEVYERSGNEGPVRSVIRAVPIAVLKPMIGASEAVSKTLLGLHNSLDPNIRQDNEAKYKHRDSRLVIT